MKLSLFVAALAVITGCGGATQKSPVDAGSTWPTTGCDRDSVEADFGVSGPITGSGVNDAGVLQPPPAGSTYIISTTYLRLQGSAASQKKFGELIGPIMGVLPTQEGLIGVQFGSSDRCGVARTLTVWRDEAAMYGYVSGDAHAAAISAVGEVSRGGSVVEHWTGTEKDATWETARSKLSTFKGTEY